MMKAAQLILCGFLVYRDDIKIYIKRLIGENVFVKLSSKPYKYLIK